MQKTDMMWLAAFTLGFMFTFMVFNIPFGLGLFLFMNAFIAALWYFGRRNTVSKELKPTPESTVLVTIFTGFFVLLTLPYLYRLDPSIIAVLVLTHLSLLFFGAIYFALPSAFHIVDFVGFIISPIALGISWFIESIKSAVDLFKENSNIVKLILKIVLYIALSLFVFILFAKLLSQADTEFKKRIDYVLESLRLSEVMGRMVWGVFISFVMAGLLTIVGSMKVLPFIGTTVEKVKERWTKAFSVIYSKRSDALLPILVTVPILLLFALYVWVQFTYLFGQDLSAILAKYSFAEYAHRGFVELLVVGVLTYPVLAWSMSQAKNEWQVPRILSFVINTGIVSMLFVMLYSLVVRMNIYLDNYGPSVLRLYVLAGTVVVALVLLVYEIFAVMKVSKPGYSLIAGIFWGDYPVVAILGVLTLIGSISLIPWPIIVVSQADQFYQKTGNIDVYQLTQLPAEAQADAYELGAKMLLKGQAAGGAFVQHQAIAVRNDYDLARSQSLFTQVFGVNVSGQRLLAVVPDTTVQSSATTLKADVKSRANYLVNQYVMALTTNNFDNARKLYDPQMKSNDIKGFAPGVSVVLASSDTVQMRNDIDELAEAFASGYNRYYTISLPFMINRSAGIKGSQTVKGISYKTGEITYVYLTLGFRNGELYIIDSSLTLAYLPDAVTGDTTTSGGNWYGYKTFCAVPNRSYLYGSGNNSCVWVSQDVANPFTATDFTIR